ncbi:uncharacterized protein At4g38062 [Oryza sativa Japonica Group]|uniref:Os03g0691500 protein n=3 Tax=Oryza TaxID=4527 RepID=B9FAP8_ORYSJ|nr:uncharacterized protein At4g38062 [Oryza sativa Japonica Group]EEE59732.1 hypothetical protein OsJ_12177 [Oryza sativa Japonica Group]KAB8093095.1 hypothetical protein EE612_019798 [Oryza sativa]KAF2940759.1 hypothetical protein DAI22_03g297700 [Oryza sativa Japonica Group]BAS85845.1 Os03g0691500 [Oryza sativa Japonica Group]
MSRSFFPTCSSLKVEMEEMCREMDELRSEVEALTAECRAKAELAEGLKRAGAEQAARLREARAEAERQAREVAARDEEISSSGEARRELEARLAEKEQALRHLCAAHEGLRSSARERSDALEAEKRELVAALEESEARRLEQEAAARSCGEEVARLRRLLSEKEKKCSEAEQRALAPKEVMMRDDMLLKMEDQKAAVEGKLKWKSEQFRHLEDALKKVQDEFRAAKKEWGSDRSMLVDQIGTLEVNLDSKTRMAEDFRSRLEMCSQALAHEEGRRKLLEAEMSELKHLYGNVVSDYEEARSTIESLAAKRDGEIASLRSSLAEKVTLLKEMEYGKARLEQENEDMRSSLKEHQEAQIGGADAVVSLKVLQQKFRALEQTHRNCIDKLRDKEAEWKTQMEKLGSELDGCLSQLDSKDTLIKQMQIELLSSYSSLEMQAVQNWEASVALVIVESKLYDSCSYFETIQLDMQKNCAQLEHNFAAARKQLEEDNCAIAQSQAERAQQVEVIATLHQRIEQLEHMEKEREEMQRQLDTYNLDNASRDVHCLKGESSEEEKGLHEKLQKALSDLDEAYSAVSERESELSQIEINLHKQKQAMEHLEELKLSMENELKGYMDENNVLKRDLIATTEIEKSLREEKEKLLGALNEANSALSEKNCELRQSEIILHQQKQALEHLEELRVNMETEIKGYIDEICVLKRDLDATHMAKIEAEKTYSEENEKLLCALDEVNCCLLDKKNELDQVTENLHQQMQAVEEFEKLRVSMETELGRYMDENSVLKSDLVSALNSKMDAEESLREEKDKLCSIIDERCRNIDELQQHIAVLEEENLDKKLDVAGLIKSEADRSIQEVNRKYSEIVEVFDKKLLELETRLSFFEQKYTCREQELMEMFDQEEADWYTLIAEKENAISEIQENVESAQVDIKHLVESASEKLAEVQVEVRQLYCLAGNLNSLNLIQEHDNLFKDMLIEECERELKAVQVNLALEKQQSNNLKNDLEQLKAKATAEMLENVKEHLEVANKLRSLEERKEVLDEHVGELKSRTKNMCNAFVQERKNLFDELTGLVDTIGAAIHVDEDLMTSLTKIMHKVNNEEAFRNSSSKEMLSSENINARNSAPLVRNKSVQLPDRRLPLKEHNY